MSAVASAPRLRLGLMGLGLALAVMMACVASADAAVYRGTAKGERISLYANREGVPTRVRFSGYKADCGPGPYRSFEDRGFQFIQPLDKATAKRLYDKGPAIRADDPDDPRVGYRIIASVRARHVSETRWKGRFRVFIKISFRGDVVDRCRGNYRFSLGLR